jgi:hypothetical protein
MVQNLVPYAGLRDTPFFGVVDVEANVRPMAICSAKQVLVQGNDVFFSAHRECEDISFTGFPGFELPPSSE